MSKATAVRLEMLETRKKAEELVVQANDDLNALYSDKLQHLFSVGKSVLKKKYGDEIYGRIEETDVPHGLYWLAAEGVRIVRVEKETITISTIEWRRGKECEEVKVPVSFFHQSDRDLARTIRKFIRSKKRADIDRAIMKLEKDLCQKKIETQEVESQLLELKRKLKA